jgi:hypothetical protein
MFQETNDTENFQGRYVLRHPWAGNKNQCEAAKQYFDQLNVRQEAEAKTLASLTGWEINEIRKKMQLQGTPPKDKGWWQNLWKTK